MAAALLVCGLVAVASVFSFAIRTNGTNRQVAVATTLLYDKMEELKGAPFTDPVWMNPAGSETVVIDGERYIRAWQLGMTVPRKVTIIVYSLRNRLTGRQTELIRASTLVSPVF